jgi:sugar lactone lactonase YvrE
MRRRADRGNAMGARRDFELALDCRNLIGESPTWDDRRSCLWWTDIQARMIHRLDWPGGAASAYPMPRRVGSLGLCESGRLILAFEDGVFLHEPGTDAFEHVATIEADIVMNRLNDGKVGPDGAFWVGSMDERTPRRPTGALYRVTTAGAVRQFDGVTVSNGLAWSADGRTMIHSDSTACRIDAFDFDPASGAIGGRRMIAAPGDDIGRPDGGASDAEGAYWSAGVSAGRLNRWSLDGRLLEALALPCPHPTMPCFAGSELRAVFVTSLRSLGGKTDLERHPRSGGLYVGALGVAGVPIARFRDL